MLMTECDTYNKELGYENTSKHLYRIEVVNQEKFIDDMKRAGIVCGIHYPALHLNSTYNDGKKINLPKSENVEKHTVSLPMNEKISFIELEYLISKVKENM